MVVLEGFYGRDLDLPDELVYQLDQHMWLKNTPGGVEVGFSQAGVRLVSGFTYLEFIAEEGQEVEAGDPFLALETYKALFQVESPLAGRVVRLNEAVAGDKVKVLDKEHYAHPLAVLAPRDAEGWAAGFLKAADYATALEQGAGDHCGAGARASRETRGQ